MKSKKFKKEYGVEKKYLKNQLKYIWWLRQANICIFMA